MHSRDWQKAIKGMDQLAAILGSNEIPPETLKEIVKLTREQLCAWLNHATQAQLAAIVACVANETRKESQHELN